MGKKSSCRRKRISGQIFLFDNYDIPAQYERTAPLVFPTTAPGNFTWKEEYQKFVMTAFYPYQWELNYGNPVVFHEMAAIFYIWQTGELIL